MPPDELYTFAHVYVHTQTMEMNTHNGDNPSVVH